MSNKTENHETTCSFCTKRSNEIRRMVAGPNVFICNECVETVVDIMRDTDEEESRKKIKASGIPTPKEIHAKLDEHVIGQEDAKKTLSIAVHNHYVRIENAGKLGDIDFDKSNVMLIGPTGTGKTLLAQTLATMLDVPFAMADANSLTEAGYVGEDVESMIHTLLSRCDHDVAKAERGIIFIDEVDKIAKKQASTSVTREVGGVGVQQALLKLLEGTEVSVPADGKRKHPGTNMIKVNTKNILFILGGSFAGIEEVTNNKGPKESSIGFGANVDKKSKSDDATSAILKVEPEDLIKFGMIQEFMGRIPVIAKMQALGEDDLIRVLQEPKNALIKQYTSLMNIYGVNLKFEPESMTAIAKRALELKTGARGLKSILEGALKETMYEAPSDKDLSEVVVTADNIMNKTPPVLVRREVPTAA